ncbi:MAG: hypothetical protein K9I59_08880 [Chlorobium sp.]|nr:hypothetical protein [Chlorobium sp.]MCF8271762.1 hypothetical protein [Chlorobium sp.]MCF8288150.1 hypothetical protein [Chlorobium sp.]MCF8385833.1 hypothetical protein [Chlorobium sp.]
MLPAFSPDLSGHARRALEKPGVQVWTCSQVNGIDELGVQIGNERIDAGTVPREAGVKASRLAGGTLFETDRTGRICFADDLRMPEDPDVFA